MKNKLTSAFASKSNLTVTENNAKTYRSTLSQVLDFFYLAPARQGQDNVGLFLQAFEEDPALALKCAFYIRDIRGGKGQKKTFRDILDHLYTDEPDIFCRIISYVPEYGRWDEVVKYVDSAEVRMIVTKQLVADRLSEHPSLLAKWMPSINTSSKETVALGAKWAERLGLSQGSYRRLLSKIRSRIGVVESLMSDNKWGGIEYSHVPSRAMKLYKDAFERHDPERFSAFVQSALKGEAKINSGTVYPHEIAYDFLHVTKDDKVLEAMWKQLPNYFGDEERNILVVVDTSSSMFTWESSKIVGTKYYALDVALGLALYCSERNVGAFKDYVLSFNTVPEIHKVTGKSLRTRIDSIRGMGVGGSTNLQAALSSVLEMAIKNRVPKKDMPTNIVIISDTEFDRCASGTNLSGIKAQYKAAKYPMPIITFWHVSARTTQVPATKDTKGIFLVSGFSAETIGKVLNSEATTPEQLMLEILNSDRYAFVDGVL